MERHPTATNRLKKVVAWRCCSIFLTLITIWLVKGDIAEATSLTFILHFILIISHWTFEWIWDERLPPNLNR